VNGEVLMQILCTVFGGYIALAIVMVVMERQRRRRKERAFLIARDEHIRNVDESWRELNELAEEYFRKKANNDQ